MPTLHPTGTSVWGSRGFWLCPLKIFVPHRQESSHQASKELSASPVPQSP
uniref:Uncharacterized protein n=1 Tax=Saimiri boliviensis boliviensis TaxID=39432 RepID=A0A2K6UKV6_SAIBB